MCYYIRSEQFVESTEAAINNLVVTTTSVADTQTQLSEVNRNLTENLCPFPEMAIIYVSLFGSLAVLSQFDIFCAVLISAVLSSLLSVVDVFC